MRGERFQWRVVAELMTRPQPVTIPLVVLLGLVPGYIFIGESMAGRTVHIPELWLDRAIPLEPAWSVVYGSLFLAAVLPVLVIHQLEHVRRTILAFMAIWLVGEACFLAYPTLTPRPEVVPEGGFSEWLLRIIYSSDVRYNCLPSLHVAQCFLAALACRLVHRGVGAVAIVWATLVALSTLFTKQHYVLDAVTGVILACASYAIFLRGYPRDAIPERERRYAPFMAMFAFGIYATVVAGFLVAYSLGT